MTLRLVGAIAFLASMILTATGAAAQVQTITATHTYVMGDRDSKEEARALCYMNAKRKVLEQAGVLIESASEVKNFDLTKDQTTSYSAAILSVEVVKEAFELHNGTHSLTLTVKADVDFEEVRKRLVAIVADKRLQTKVDAQEQKMRQLEEKVQRLNEKLGGISPNAQEEVRKDRDVQMADYYRVWAERGEAESQFYLGLTYAEGKGVPQDFTQAVSWWRKAAEQGLASAQFNLGQAYDKGDGVPQDLIQAITWWRKAAEQGYADAQYNLGWAYDKGQGVPKDDAQAAVWYRRAAEQGLAAAQYALGVEYVKSKDFNQAAVWLRKAAEQELAKAQLLLGALYDSGKGMPQDHVQAVTWYRKAAEQGFAKAQGSLGLKYAAGMGVPKDYVLAYKWFNLAAAKGDTDSIEYRDRMAQQLTSDQLTEAQRLAREWTESFEKKRAGK